MQGVRGEINGARVRKLVRWGGGGSSEGERGGRWGGGRGGGGGGGGGSGSGNNGGFVAYTVSDVNVGRNTSIFSNSSSRRPNCLACSTVAISRCAAALINVFVLRGENRFNSVLQKIVLR